MNVYDEEDALLAAVGAIEDDEASGEAPTAEAIARRLGREVGPGTDLIPMRAVLRRLVRGGMLTEMPPGYVPSMQAGPSGPSIYRVTAAGREVLAERG